MAVACALIVFAGPEAEVEPHLDQVGDVMGIGVGDVGSGGHNGLNDPQGGRFSSLDWGILDPVCFELPGEALVNTGVSL